MTLLSHPWRERQIIAHRGSRLLWPENTLVAFDGGLRAGAHHLETDLHLTADGHVVCLHDDLLDRTTDGTGPVAALTLSELRRLDAGYNHRLDGEFPFRARGIRVPTLGEVLATFPDAGVVVDLKQDGLERPLAALLDRMDAWGRVIIGSFSDRRLVTMIRESSGKAQVSAGPRAARKWWLASRVGRPGPAGYVALQVPPSMYGLGVIDRRFVRTAERAGLQVHVWTVNQPADVARLWELGVHGIITDRPDHIAARL